MIVDGRTADSGKSKVKQVAGKQRTLLDLFPRKTNRPSGDPKLDDAKEGQETREEDVIAPVELHPEVASEAEDSVLRNTDNSRPRALHPFFTGVSKGRQVQHAVEDIIEIIEDAPPLNALSAPRSTESSFLHQNGGSQQDPIVVDSSPIKPLNPHRYRVTVPPKQSFDLHQEKGSFPSRTPGPRYTDAPFPQGTSQHVRGPQQTFTALDLPYPYRKKQRYAGLEQSHADMPLLPILRNQENDVSFPHMQDSLQGTIRPATSDRETYINSIPEEHRGHAAISRLVGPHAQTFVSSSSSKLWVDKRHPTCAEEVLGNESNALYLRDWLQALELQFDTKGANVAPDIRKAKAQGRGTKRPRVIRTVNKRRGRKKRKINSDDEDDWIVYGDVLDEDIGQDDPWEVETREHLASQGQIPKQSFDTLTNTILLAGPSGTGKTAAAYACAQELGWEVFEVYPGIGKRNGANIENMVGDVGKNHIVRRAIASESRNPLAAFLRNEIAQVPLSGGLDVGDGCLDRGDFGFISDTHPGTGDATSTFRQSLILLEEVDILFKDDVNFWPSVTNFIKECRRPVICTCNDISLIPMDDIPLQTILVFKPCPAPIAASYMQGICYAEGYLAERHSLLRLYESTKTSLIHPQESPTFKTPCDISSPDLRQSINSLQLQCTTTRNNGAVAYSEASDENISDWTWDIEEGWTPPAGMGSREGAVVDELAANHADLISFVDCFLMWKPLDTEALLSRSPERTSDDEVGHQMLYPSAEARYDRRTDMGSAVMLLSRGDAGPGLFIGADGLFRARVNHEEQMGEALEMILPVGLRTMSSAIVYMEYVPWVREMVEVEDTEEKKYMEQERRGRTTRNSKGVYVRTVCVSDAGRLVLKGTLLGRVV